MAKKLGIAALTLVIMGGVGLWAAGSAPQLASMAAEAQETAAIEIKDFTLGAADAPVKLTEYASFTCPHCATFHKDIFGKLKAV
jgi:protein-disulfide isomerase